MICHHVFLKGLVASCFGRMLELCSLWELLMWFPLCALLHVYLCLHLPHTLSCSLSFHPLTCCHSPTSFLPPTPLFPPSPFFLPSPLFTPTPFFPLLLSFPLFLSLSPPPSPLLPPLPLFPLLLSSPSLSPAKHLSAAARFRELVVVLRLHQQRRRLLWPLNLFRWISTSTMR